MKNKTILFIFLSFCCNFALFSQSCVKESLSFQSDKLGKKVSYSVYLPSDYDVSQRKYPVLYLLHGYSDNETSWIQSGNIKETADRAIASGEAVPMIIVMPNAWNSWYLNPYDGKAPYEDMFFEELIPHIEKTYHTRQGKDYRAIGGVSMGGYSALLYTLHHPDYFSACMPLSAAIHTDEYMEYLVKDDAFYRLYGPQKAYRDKNSIIQLVADLTKDTKPRVKFYIDCGDKDSLLDGNILMHQLMRQIGIPHELRVREGGHGWIYWRTSLPEVLKFSSKAFLRIR